MDRNGNDRRKREAGRVERKRAGRRDSFLREERGQPMLTPQWGVPEGGRQLGLTLTAYSNYQVATGLRKSLQVGRDWQCFSALPRKPHKLTQTRVHFLATRGALSLDIPLAIANGPGKHWERSPQADRHRQTLRPGQCGTTPQPTAPGYV